MNSTLLISKGVVLETIRRQEFHLVVIIGVLLLLKAIVSRLIGIENPETGTLLLNFGMTVAWWTALIFTLLTVSGILPKEIENRTIYLLMARPITRARLYVGKWVAGAGLGCAAYAALMFVAWLPSPRMEVVSGAMFAQAMIFGFLAIILLATLTQMISLLLPQPVTIVLMALVTAAGETLAGLVRATLRSDAASSFVGWAANYLPPFSRLNLITRYTDGIGPLPVGDALALGTHVVLIALVTMSLGVILFHRRAL